MAKLIVGSRGFDMTAWDLSDIATGTVSASSATEVDVTGAGGQLVYEITGTGFTTFDASGFPTDGTVTGFVQTVPGKTPLTITGISMSAADFMGFVNTNNAAGLEATIFAGADTLFGRAHDDVLLGFGGNDSFNLTAGGNDIAKGGDGNDHFHFDAAFTAADSVDGGTGTDTLFLNGDYSAAFTFAPATMVNVESIVVTGGFSYNLILDEATIGAGQTLTVHGENLHSGDHFTIDGSADTDGVLVALGSAFGNNAFIAGSGEAHFHAGGSNNNFIFHGFNAGNQVFGDNTSDIVTFNGDFSGGLTLNKHEISHVGQIAFAAGHDYDVTIGANFGTANFNGQAMGVGDTLILDDSAATIEVTVRTGLGDNTVTTGSGFDFITANGSGVNIIDAGEGQNSIDIINWNPADRITGGSNFAFSTSLEIHSMPGHTEFVSGTLTDVVGLQIDGSSVDLTIDDGNVASQGLSIGFSSATTAITVDGSAETAGHFFFSFAGGNANAVAHLTGGTGDDTFYFSGTTSLFNVQDTLDGGAGNDTLVLQGGTFTLKPTTLTSVETLDLDESKNLTLTMNDGNVAAGHVLTVNGTNVNNLIFNGSKETDGTFHITVEGAGPATITGGAGDDVINSADAGSVNGGDGNDTITATAGAIVTGGAGADHLIQVSQLLYHDVSESTSTLYDTLSFISFNAIRINLPGTVSAIDAAVTTGALSTASFDSDLATAIGSGQLGVNHAVLFTANSGTLSGDTFLIVDANGVAGYQAGADYVFLVDHTLGTLSTTDFK